MTPELFLENFGHLVEGPGGVAKLRELVLRLAVRGLLGQQRSTDEPARVLLERLRAVRKGGRPVMGARLGPALALPAEGDCPYPIPSNWKWVHLSDVGQIVGGGTPKTANPELWADEGVRWLTPADMSSLRGKYIARGRRDISDKGLRRSAAQLMPAGTVLFSSRAPIGHVAIAANPLATNQGFKSCVPFIMEMSAYIYVFLLASREEIARNASGTTFKEVSGKEVGKILFPLPPVAEQHRIVAKVDQLMALCDELEERQQKRNETRIALNNASLDHLLIAPDDKTFTRHWHRIHDHFELLYQSPEAVGRLSQGVLQLAVRGRLVPQDPTDTPAASLLKDLSRSREVFVDSRKLRKPKPLKPLTQEEVPYEIPDSWEWARFGHAFHVIRGASPRPKGDPRYFSEERTPYHWIKISDIRKNSDGVTLFDTAEFLTSDGATKSVRVEEGTLLLTNSATIGVPVFLGIEGYIHDGYLAFPHIDERLCSSRYVYYFFLQFKAELEKRAFGGAQLNLNTSIVRGLPFPLPPRKEQARIVTRVDQLMALCEQLETSLRASQGKAEALMESVVHHLVAA